MRDNVISLKVGYFLLKCFSCMYISNSAALLILQVVLANGEIMKTASRARKSAAG